MASTPTRLMTFAEFEQLPTPQDGRLELRHGEVVKVPPPKLKHAVVQDNLYGLLKQAAVGAGRIFLEFGFKALPEGEYRTADVVFISQDRWNQRKDGSYFTDAPDLVIEVLSPSNTATEMRDRKKVCLENGSVEFWIVDLALREIEVSMLDGHSVTYKSGQEIPLFFGGSITADAIFA